MAAGCLLEVLSRERNDEDDGDGALVRRYVGALLIDDARRELVLIRKALTTER